MNKKIMALLTGTLFSAQLLFALPGDIDSQLAKLPAYTGPGLEVTVTPTSTDFMLWSPQAEAVKLMLYPTDRNSAPTSTIDMRKSANGTWTVSLPGQLYGQFYTFTVKYNGKWLDPTPGVWAKALGTNGERAAIIDFANTNPKGWESDKGPKVAAITDAVIYEMHHRDFSVHPSSGIVNKGKFLALTEQGTVTPLGDKTGIDHLKELGVTHVHILPSFDYNSVDESNLPSNQYNWGYDPVNYNAPEGSYSTNPADPEARVREMKEMVKALHDAGIGVIMDVVYNHTAQNDDSNFSLTAPGYYYRHRADGSYSDASACGNETASEREQMRDFIKKSIAWWADEYHIDGFRFDLMAVLDCDTVNAIRAELDKLYPYIMMYGEGWSGGSCALESSRLCYKWNCRAFPQVGVFNDNFRDAVKGATFDVYQRGYVCGNTDLTNIIKRGLAGSVSHPDILGNDEAAWAQSPTQTINYCEAHDNWTMWDKIFISANDYSQEEKIAADKLSAALILLAQGIPFFQLGEDFLRSKPKFFEQEPTAVHEMFEDNSYNSPDYTNAIRWGEKVRNIDVFKYVRGLIELRREAALFRMGSADEIRAKLHFLPTNDLGVIEMKLEDDCDCFIVAFNPYREEKWVELPEGVFFVRYSEKGKQHEFPMNQNPVKIPPISAVVFERYGRELYECKNNIRHFENRLGLHTLI